MNLSKTNNTLHLPGTRPAVAALLFALTLGMSTLASAAPKDGSGAKNQPVEAAPNVCTIQVDLADVADTNAPDGEAPLSLIVSTQTQLWAQDVSASSPNNQASSQSQSSKKSVEADASGFLTPDAVDTAVASYILEVGTAEVVQICSMIATNRGRRNASEFYCEELVLSCDMAGEAVASDVSLCLDAGSVSQDLCASEHTAVVRLTYTFTNTDLIVETPLDTLTPTLGDDSEDENHCSACDEDCEEDGKGKAILNGSMTRPTQEPCTIGGTEGFKTCTGRYMSYQCELDSSPRREYVRETDCGDCIPTSSDGPGPEEDKPDLLD